MLTVPELASFTNILQQPSQLVPVILAKIHDHDLCKGCSHCCTYPTRTECVASIKKFMVCSNNSIKSFDGSFAFGLKNAFLVSKSLFKPMNPCFCDDTVILEWTHYPLYHHLQWQLLKIILNVSDSNSLKVCIALYIFIESNRLKTYETSMNTNVQLETITCLQNKYGSDMACESLVIAYLLQSLYNDDYHLVLHYPTFLLVSWNYLSLSEKYPSLL